MTTPTGVTILARAEDGTETEITEGVQALYDHLINTLDWGSDFFSYEDVVPIAELAKLCGFTDLAEAEKYLNMRLREKYELALMDSGIPYMDAKVQAKQEYPA